MADTITLADIAGPFLPTQPRHHLGREPWIDIVRVGRNDAEQLSLRDVLTQAHELDLNPGARGPLWEHAMHRLLIAFAYLVYANDPDADWEAIAAGQQPLPSHAVNAVLERFDDRLWLHHPTVPFLQNLDVLAHVNAKHHKDRAKALDDATHGFWTLLPEIPAGTNVSWFSRHQDRPAPTWQDTAAALLVRHYWALPGNEQPNDVAGGMNSKGGPTRLTNAGRSYALIRKATLSATLTSNLLSDWCDTVTPDSPTFIEAREPAFADSGGVGDQSLWFYTATTAATVLIPADHHPDGYRVVRTPELAPAPVAKARALLIEANDPHCLRVPAKSAAQKATKPYSHLVLPARSDLTLLQKFYRDLVAANGRLEAPSVLVTSDLLVEPSASVQLLNIEGAGSSTGPRIAGTALYDPPQGSLTLPVEQADAYLRVANKISGAKGAASRLVGRHLHLTLSQDAASDPPGWLYPTCDQELATAAEPVLVDLLRRCTDGGPQEAELAEDAKRRVSAAALRLFDQLAEPHMGRPATAARAIQQRHRLRRRLTAI